MDDDNKEPPSSVRLMPRRWKDRYRWLGLLIMAAFAGLGPAPPPPKPPQDTSEYSQIADDSDEPNLDPELYFLQNAFHKDDSGIDVYQIRSRN